MPYNIILGRTESDKKKFGDRGTILLGRSYVKMGATTSLSNKVFMDVARSHVVLVAGKRGCLTEETMIYTNKGYKKIKDFKENKDKIYSFDKDRGRLELEKAQLLKYKINEDLIVIKLKDGQELMATAEHPFLVKDNKKYSWKIASELTIKDKIVSVLELPKISIHSGVSKRMARLLGFVLADGTLFMQKGKFKDGRGCWYNGTKKRLRIFNRQEEVLQQAKKDLEAEFKIKAKRYERKDCNCEVIETKHQKIVNKFVSLGVPIGKKSSIIRVPKSIFSASKDTKAEFLKALFSCDGTIGKRGKDIEYYSNSREFLKDLQLILNEFGMHGKVREKKVTCNGKRFLSYALSMWDYESIKLFEDYIGFLSKEKMKRLKERKFWRMSRRKKTEYISNEFFFEDIIKISKKKHKGFVYDLRVSKNHSFIANGIISHNSGKSYTLSVMAEEMARLEHDIKKNLSMLFFDTMGIFWTMKYPNERDEDLLKKWNLEPEGFDVEVYVPQGSFEEYQERGLPVDHSFSIKTSELSSSDWCDVFEIKIIEPIGILIDRIVSDLKEEGDYDIIDIIRRIKVDKRSDKDVKNACENRFLAAQKWGLFSISGTKVSELIKPGKITILDISAYKEGRNIKGLVVGLLSKKILAERIVSRKAEELEAIEEGSKYFGEQEVQEKPLIWLFIDEGHIFLPKEGENPAKIPLIHLLREGRQPGISMVIATQQPGEIARDVMTQSDIVFSHRVTAKADIESLNAIMQTYLLSDVQAYLNNLPRLKGSAIILDDNSERIYPMRVRPKISWHGGETPTSVKISKKEELSLL